jgi:ABC-type glycerol-3-phosphate transport system substrate-binding protein
MRLKQVFRWICGLTLCLAASASAAQSVPAEDDDGALATPQVLRIWMPETLIGGIEAAAGALAAQTAGFAQANGDVLIDLRIKRDSNVGPGSLMTTLRNASAVAPGALPHLTLVRRADLVALVRDGLAEPMPARAASLLGDMPVSMGELGRVDGVLYAIPYLAEFAHLVYRETDAAPETWSFEAVVDAEFAYLFPAQNTGINDVLYAQYAAGFEDPPAAERLTLEEEPLRALLAYMEQAADVSVLDPAALLYGSTGAYAADVLSGARPAGVLTSTNYLRARETDGSLSFAPLPTADGAPAAVVDAWMWIIPAGSIDTGERAVDMLFYLMDPRRQQEFAQATGALPTARAALSDFADARYEAFVSRAFSRALIPITADSRDAVVMRAIQNAVASILAGEVDAETALDSVLAR